MPSFKLVNSLSTYPAEFRVLQGTDVVARIGVNAKAEADVPTGNSYQVQAVTSMGDFTLKSNLVSFDASSAHLLAQVRMDQPGLYDFKLVQLNQGLKPSQIICENTWREPVSFNVWRNGSPMAIVKVVDEHNIESVSTLQQWDVYAIINGITTLAVRTNDPDATITAVADNNDDGFAVTVD